MDGGSEAHNFKKTFLMSWFDFATNAMNRDGKYKMMIQLTNVERINTILCRPFKFWCGFPDAEDSGKMKVDANT